MKKETREYLKSGIAVLFLSAIAFAAYYYSVIAHYDKLPPEAKTALADPYIYMWWE